MPFVVSRRGRAPGLGSPAGRLVVWTVVAVHLVALYWPRVEVPLDVPALSDKVAHLLLFGVPVALAMAALRRPWPVVGLLAVHAPVSEWLQATLLPGRSGDWRDAVADLVGVAVGVLVGWWVRRRW
ncbi:MAG TPA: VanZ family protein [Dermatophilaceae bacterium]|mgnify:CR=1 FL=1|nr:VanZ family protein [Dermatophilaceae bacterium]